MATLSTRNINTITIPPVASPNIGAYTFSNNHSINNVFSLDSFMNDRNMNPDVKKYEIYESPIDLLALSSAWKRLRDAGTAQGRIGKLLDKDLFESLISEDYSQAERIRDYYSKKIVMWKLKGERMSNYRNDLCTFVHSDGTKFREEMLGLAYYLPAFYEYDNQLDEVRLQVEPPCLAKNPMINSSRTLTPIKRIMQKTKRVSVVQYWLKDTRNDYAVMIQIEAKNQLEHLWNHVFNNNNLIEIKGNFHLKQRDNFEYLSVTNWELTRG
jgi:hypothetical protein